MMAKPILDKDIEQGNVHDARAVLAELRNRRGL